MQGGMELAEGLGLLGPVLIYAGLVVVTLVVCGIAAIGRWLTRRP